MSESMSEQAARPAGHEYVVVDGLGGPWLAEVSTEYPELSPIGLIDDILSVSGAVAKPDDLRERWQAVAGEIMEHFRSIGSNVSGTYVSLVMSEVWKRRQQLTSIPVAKHEQEVRAAELREVADLFAPGNGHALTVNAHSRSEVAANMVAFLRGRADALSEGPTETVTYDSFGAPIVRMGGEGA